MSRRKKAPLGPVTPQERATLAQVTRSHSERADRVARATALLAVADGATYAASRAGRRSGDGVAQLVARFTRLALAALDRRYGGGPPTQYGPAARDRILAEFERLPDREQDGTASWSLTTLQRALHRAPDGLPAVSTFTIFQSRSNTVWPTSAAGKATVRGTSVSGRTCSICGRWPSSTICMSGLASKPPPM